MATAQILTLITTTFGVLLTAVATARTLRTEMGRPKRRPEAEFTASVYCLAGFAFFSWVLIYGSLVPFSYQPYDLRAAIGEFTELLSQPLRIASRSDWIGNILVAIPIGFFLSAAFSLSGVRWLRMVGPAIAMLSCVAMSGGVEFAQIWSPVRFASPADVVAQAVGAGVGVCLGLLLEPWLLLVLPRILPDPRRMSWLQWALHAYLVWLVIDAMLPLDLVISPRDLWYKFKLGGIQPIPLADIPPTLASAWQLLWDSVVFVPAGVLIATWNLRPDQRLRTWPGCVVLGLIVAGGVELAQVFVFSRWATGTDVLTGFAGICLGVLLARRVLSVESSPGGGELGGGDRAGPSPRPSRTRRNPCD